MSKALLDPRLVGGSFRLRTHPRRPATAAVDMFADVRTRALRLPYGDQAIFVRRSAFESVGGFPDVPLAEDVLFVQRLQREGGLALLDATVTASGRRWQVVGAVRGLLWNQVISAGLRLGVPPRLLTKLYRTHRSG